MPINLFKEPEEQKEKATGDKAVAGKEVTGEPPTVTELVQWKVSEDSTALGTAG